MGDVDILDSEAAAPPLGRRRAPLIVGAISAAGAVAFLVPGARRGYDLDSGLTVGMFVATRSIGDAFTKTFLFTNQVFFSFLEHLVYSATGSKSELVMRALPIALAAAAVGVFAWLVTARWGAVPGLAGAAVLATNPLFAVESSQVRGYSLVLLCTIVTTALLLQGLSGKPMSITARVGYAVFGAIGVATHLYMLVVLGIHAIMWLSAPRRAQQLVLPWLAALLGICAWLPGERKLQVVVRITGRRFQPTFPRDLWVELLGGSVVAIIVMLLIVAPVAWRARRDRVVLLGAGAVVAAVVTMWLLAPQFLYPRFFLWLAPVGALAAAVAVARRPVVVALVALVVVLQVHTAWPRLVTSQYPNRRAEQIFKEVTDRHGHACVLNEYTGLRLVAYTTNWSVLEYRDRRGPCTVAFVIGAPPDAVVRDLDRIFPYHTTLPARTDGELWSVVPTECWTSRPAPPDCDV